MLHGVVGVLCMWVLHSTSSSNQSESQIRLLSAEASSNGRTLWKSPEELKLFKKGLARYLTTNYYDSRAVLEPDMYLNFKSQRSADWLHGNRGHQSPGNFHHGHPFWREETFMTREPRRPFPASASIYSGGPYLETPAGTIAHGLSTAFVPTILPVTEPSPTPVVVPITHQKTSTSTPPTVEQHGTTTWSSSSATKQQIPIVTVVNQQNVSGIHPLRSMYEQSSFSIYEYARTEPEITTLKDLERPTISAENLFHMEKSKMAGIYKTDAKFDENDKSSEEEGQSRTLSRRKFKTNNVTDHSERTVTEDGHFSHTKLEESSTEAEKQRKRAKGTRRSDKKRVAKSHQQSSTAASDTKEKGGD